MSFIKTIAPDEATGDVRLMYERQQAAWGYVPNYAKSFSHRPEVMARWGKLLAELRRPMDDRTFELVTFAAAHELCNSSCSLAHGDKLRAFFNDAEIQAIAGQDGLEFLSEGEQAMLGFARKVARDAATVEKADIDTLKGFGYSDAEVFDIAAAVAGRAFFTKVLDAMGSLPDQAFLSIGDELVTRLTVGRSIDTRKPEVMTDASS
jgi:uncharacterized peroxidase-related enzyme